MFCLLLVCKIAALFELRNSSLLSERTSAERKLRSCSHFLRFTNGWRWVAFAHLLPYSLLLAAASVVTTRTTRLARQ